MWEEKILILLIIYEFSIIIIQVLEVVLKVNEGGAAGVESKVKELCESDKDKMNPFELLYCGV